MKKLLASSCSDRARARWQGLWMKSSSTTASGGSSGQSKGSTADIDKHGEQIMASSTKAEAREWMKQPKHVFFKEDPKVVAQFVEDFYQAGAVQVFIGDVEDHDGTQYGHAARGAAQRPGRARQGVPRPKMGEHPVSG